MAIGVSTGVAFEVDTDTVIVMPTDLQRLSVKAMVSVWWSAHPPFSGNEDGLWRSAGLQAFSTTGRSDVMKD